MSKWYDIYVKRMNTEYFNHVKKKYEVFIDLIEIKSKLNARMLEVGCGTANITKALIERKNYQVEKRNHYSQMLASDKDEKMLSLAMSNLEVELSQKKAHLSRADIFDQYLFDGLQIDTIHSHGLMEHFTDDQIRKALKIQMSLKPSLIIHYVPGEKYVTPSFGDERLLSQEQWKTICDPTEIVAFNDGYDYALIWRTK